MHTKTTRRPQIPKTKADATALDAVDPLHSAKAKFALSSDLIYLNGNSLGPAPKSALKAVEIAAKEEWAQGLIRSWNDAGWIDMPARVGAKIAPLIGVAENEVLICDSVSVNLFKLAAACLPVAGGKKVLYVEEDEFPTDLYIAQGLSELAGVKTVRLPQSGGIEAIAKGGVLIKSAVNYRSARVIDIAAHEAAAAQNRGLIIWDLSHASGAIDLRLAERGARLATGCTYKYLNGGPGAPAFIYAESALAAKLNSPLSGWFGHRAQFAFDPDFVPLPGVARFAVGTPQILSMAALSGALDIYANIAIADIQIKMRGLVNLCLSRGSDLGLQNLCADNEAERGGHVCLVHENGYPIIQALIARNIIADFRAPGAMRFGFSPLFVSYTDVWDAMDALAEIIETESWNAPEFMSRSKVT